MVPWDTLITGAVGVAGIGGTILAARITSKSQMAVARQQTEAQVAVAREERQQRRLEEAYLEMLAAITSIYYWVPTVYPILTRMAEEFTMPPLPVLPDNAKKEALWTAYWSPRVEHLMKGWEQKVFALQHAGMAIGLGRSLEAQGQVPTIDVAAKLIELPDLKQAVIEADKKVRYQVRAELIGQDDGRLAS
jgi:hypothetical protein